MKLAISNVAWPQDQDLAVAELLARFDVTGIEVAPTKIWPQPLEATNQQIDDYRRFWNDWGIRIVAAQALLFGHPELTLFDSVAVREQTLEYLRGIMRVCGRLGAKALVFGSPKNRRIGSQGVTAVWPVAVDFLRRLGESAIEEETCVVLEANPPAYGADFITRAGDAIELVRAVNHPGFRLHLDTGCMTLAGDPIEQVFMTGMALARHFHVSEPELAAVGAGSKVDHAAFARQLAQHHYGHWVSIEMRETQPFTLDSLQRAIEFTRQTYGLI